MWVVAWTPYAVVALIGTSGYADLLTPTSSMIPALAAKSAACIDPFIYSLNHPKIRQEIMQRVYNVSVAFMHERRTGANSSATSSAQNVTVRNNVLSRIVTENCTSSKAAHTASSSQQHGRIGSLMYNSSQRMHTRKNAILVQSSRDEQCTLQENSNFQCGKSGNDREEAVELSVLAEVQVINEQKLPTRVTHFNERRTKSICYNDQVSIPMNLSAAPFRQPVSCVDIISACSTV